jgi:hypothetical protein
MEDVLTSFNQRTLHLRRKATRRVMECTWVSRLRIPEIRIDVQATKILVETSRREFKTQLAIVEVRVELGSCGRTWTGVAQRNQVRRIDIMGQIPTTVRDRGGAQLPDTPRERHLTSKEAARAFADRIRERDVKTTDTHWGGGGQEETQRCLT